MMGSYSQGQRKQGSLNSADLAQGHKGQGRRNEEKYTHLLQSAHLQQSAGLVSKLRDVGLEDLSDESEAQRLQSIGRLPESRSRRVVCEPNYAFSAAPCDHCGLQFVSIQAS